jgi:hypothetical protein
MMRMAGRKLFTPMLLTVVVLMAFPLFADQLVDGWNLTVGNDGMVTAMSVSNPQTYLKIEEVVKIKIDNQGIPQGGSVKFKMSGFERECPPGEVAFFWENFKGQHALWDYLAAHGAQGKLKSINSQNEAVPASWYGKMTKVVTKNDIELFGTLAVSPDASSVFLLQIEGAGGGPIRLERQAVTLMQQMK